MKYSILAFSAAFTVSVAVAQPAHTPAPQTSRKVPQPQTTDSKAWPYYNDEMTVPHQPPQAGAPRAPGDGFAGDPVDDPIAVCPRA